MYYDDEEIDLYLTDDELAHYGMPRRSGRYKWGSGEDPYQHSKDFLCRIDELKNQNFVYTDPETGKKYTGDTAIAKSMGLTSTQFRIQRSLALEERRMPLVATAKSLRADGYSLNEIAEKMGYKNDSSVRSLLNEKSEDRMREAKNTANFLKEKVEEKGMIEVGAGVERELNISKEKMKTALYMLEMEGYPTYGGRVSQVTNGARKTTITVLCPKGTEHKEIFNLEDIHSVNEYVSHDDGETFDKFVYPKSMDINRVKIRYADEPGPDGPTGIEKDGLIEIRRNVPDLSLGESHYSQVRILVDNDRYMKGMAAYSDNMPDGVDVVFNTNKKAGTPAGDVFKKVKDDPDNPFGSLIKAGGQSYYEDENGKKQLSLINKRADEGDWNDWSDRLPSQFLGKQPKSLIKKQLGIAMDDKQAEYDDICQIDNPTVKKKLLQSFADDCDSTALHLNAAALPRQKYRVILPIPSLKDNEVYAPDYNDGEQLALIRFPHGGTFEIPILTVNNKNKAAKDMLGTTPKDGIGINSKVAERLSGADFDGDTTMVIPTNSKVKIKSTDPLKGLVGFDPKLEYGGTVVEDADGNEHYYRDGHEYRKMNNTQNEMGKISNLITDMTLKGADEKELARAVRHSMVVIDAEKHKLDYKQSYEDNSIATLKKKYQGHYDADGKYHESASTLLSRAKGQQPVLKRKGSPKIDPETGKVSWDLADDLQYINKDGKLITRTMKSTQMAETDDARTLSSGSVTEEYYAEYANKMKSLANQARKEMVSTGNLQYNPKAKKEYAEEVASLMSELNISEKNHSKERMAQIMANANMEAKKKLYGSDMKKEDIKKESQRALAAARVKVGAKRVPIKMTDKKWEAIQAGAITENILKKIIDNCDLDDLRQRATPRTNGMALSDAKIARIETLKAQGYTTAQIAAATNVSSSTVTKYLSGKEK